MDWQAIEAAGKYVGLAGVALIGLLLAFRLITKLKIYKGLDSAGTFFTRQQHYQVNL